MHKVSAGGHVSEKRAPNPRAEKPGRGGGAGQRSPFASPIAWLVLVALAVFLFRAFQDVGVRRIGYSQWKDMLRAGSFEKVVVGPDWVRGYPKPVGAGEDSSKRAASGNGNQALPYVANRMP